MRLQVVGIALGALMLATGAQSTAAQREPADCAARSARVMRASPDENRAELLAQCLESGPATLAALWLHRPPTTHYALRELRYVSVTIGDVRILDAVERVVDATDRSTQERVAALNVLLYYYDHTLAPVDTEFVDPNTLTLANVTDTARPNDGAQPLPPDVRSRIANRLARIASTDPDVIFRRVALRVRQTLAYRDPVNTPVSAGTVTLIAGCGDRVTLRSTADIDLPVEVRALDSTRAYRGGIRRGTTAKPSEILLGLPPGVVVATLGGREIARLTQRDAPCTPGQIRGRVGVRAAPLPAAPTSRSPRTLVAVLAHADDEAPVAPILARYAREGDRVFMLIVSDGIAGAGQQGFLPRPDSGPTGEALVRQRAEEARCAAQALGMQPPILLGFPDGKLGDYAGDRSLVFRMTQRLAQELERLRPDVVLTWGPEGGFGHPDHRIVSTLVTQLQRAGAPGVPDRVFFMYLPAEAIRAMNPQRGAPPLTIPLPKYFTVRVPFGERDLEAATRSMACHRSQYTAETVQRVAPAMGRIWNGVIALVPAFEGGAETDLFR